MRHLFREIELISSREFSLEGIHTIWVETASQDIVFYKEDREGLLVKEYACEQSEIAFVEKRGDALCFTLKEACHVLFSFGGAENHAHICFSVPDSFHGQIYAGTAAGDVEFPGTWELANLQTNTASGDICIGAVKAEHSLVETKSGDIDIENIWGDRQITSISGDICIGDGSGRLCIHNTSGDIDAVNRTGCIQVKNTSGDICVTAVTPEGESQISSVNGDVDIKIAADSPCCMKAKTVNGDIALHMKAVQIIRQSAKSVEFVSGDLTTNKTLEVSTVNGDICLHN